MCCECERCREQTPDNTYPDHKMKTISFQLNYFTQPDECLAVSYSASDGTQGRLLLGGDAAGMWRGTLRTDPEVQWVEYIYMVYAGERCVRREAGGGRHISLHGRSHVLLSDAWTDEGLLPAFRHTAFTENVFGPQHGAVCAEVHGAKHLLLLTALPAPDGFRWGVSGSSAALGEWAPARAVALQRTGTYEWACALDDDDLSGGTEFKVVLISDGEHDRVLWERGANRRVARAEGADCVFVNISSPGFDIPLWRGAGVVVPVFSLRSRGSQGVGDFGDLLRLVDWAAATGMHAVQVLPVNDTTREGGWQDSYPYSGISVFALHPLYLDLREWAYSPAYDPEEAKELNALAELDYERVFRYKTAFLRRLFKLEGKTLMQGEDYDRFVGENRFWLDPYAQFCQLRDEQGTADFRLWKRVVRSGRSRGVGAGFYRFVQYLLHRQLRRVRQEARSKGVILKGDIPIGVCRDSVPAWKEGRLFHFDGQAGAPPDYFSEHGQNWGFPTYDWDAMAADGYRWWRRRMAHMGNYFDAYRIDHVLGFFRIWEIPVTQVHGTLGRFRPALPLTADEIKGAGFTLPVWLYVRPHLSERQFSQLAARSGSARAFADFFQKEGGYYTLRPECRDQRSILRLTDPGTLRDVLMDVVGEVLFLEDGERSGCYHPRVMAQRTDAYRSLPPDQQAAFDRLHDDFFFVRHNRFWAEGAMAKLRPLLYPEAGVATEAGLLPCAEDLGMVPQGVKEVLEQLNILTLEIQTMPKTSGRRFARLEENPYLSVATIATHDMAPFRLWWQQDHARAQAFWNEALQQAGTAPGEATPEVCAMVVRRHLECPSMLCLLALQDWLAIDAQLRRPRPEEEQINNPANSHHYWRYRMHLDLEDLFVAANFNEHVRTMIAGSGR